MLQLFAATKVKVSTKNNCAYLLGAFVIAIRILLALALTFTFGTPTAASASDDFTVHVSGPTAATWGQTIQIKVTTSPKVSGTCYFVMVDQKAGSAKLSHGALTVKLMALFQGDLGRARRVAVNVDCTAGKLSGQGYTIFTGYR